MMMIVIVAVAVASDRPFSSSRGLFTPLSVVPATPVTLLSLLLFCSCCPCYCYIVIVSVIVSVVFVGVYILVVVAAAFPPLILWLSIHLHILSGSLDTVS